MQNPVPVACFDPKSGKLLFKQKPLLRKNPKGPPSAEEFCLPSFGTD